MSDKKKTYFERAVEISTSNQNCEDDNWGDWCNLCGEADAEIIRLAEENRKLKAALDNKDPEGHFKQLLEANSKITEDLRLAKAALDGFGDKEIV